MAPIGTFFRQMSKCQNFCSTFQRLKNFSTLPAPHCPKPCINPLQGRSISSPTGTLSGIGDMISAPEKNYYIFAGKFVDYNNPTSGFSTYPALPVDSFDQCTSGILPIQGVNSLLLPLEMISGKTTEDVHSSSQRNDGSNIRNIMDSMGLGIISQQSEELLLGELLVTLPADVQEALGIPEAFSAAARSLSLNAILEYSYFARSASARTIRCATKKIKFAKQRKGSMKGISHRGNFVAFGNYALQVLEPAWITSKQLEAGRRALSRIVGRAAKIWVRAICDKPVTQRPAETRMGRGKGNVSFWVAVVQPGRILYEVSGVSESIARKAITVAASKLPVQTRFIISA